MRTHSAVLSTILILVACESATEPVPCTAAQAYAVGATVTGRIDDGDCSIEGRGRADIYQFTLATTSAIQLSLSDASSANLLLASGVIAGPQAPRVIIGFDETGDFTARAFLPPGTYTIAISGKGSYRLSTGPTDSNVCSDNFTMPPITITGTITTADCAGAGTARQDVYEIAMTAGQTIQVNASLTKMGAVLWRTGDATTPDLITRLINSPTGGSAQMSFTATRADYYRVHVISEPLATGVASYTVSIQ